MAEDNRLRRFAVLIDADNTSPRIAAGLFEEIAKFGEASVAADLRRFLEPAPQVVGRHPAEVRDRSLPAVRLHVGQERLRHRPGDRRHGPAAQPPVRRLLPGLVGQRLHAPGVAPARGGRRRLRLRRAEDARRASGRRAGASSIPRTCCPRPRCRRRKKDLACKGRQPASAAVPILTKAIAQMETEDGWVGSGRGRPAPGQHRLRFRPAHLRLSQAERPRSPDRRLRHGSAGRPGGADQGKADAAGQEPRQGAGGGCHTAVTLGLRASFRALGHFARCFCRCPRLSPKGRCAPTPTPSPQAGKFTRLGNSQEPAGAAATDARAWTQVLARYRQPSTGRSIVEIAITVLPLAALWALAWATLDIGYWLALPLALAAAGFLVRLFAIQHDCSHGAFFRHRLANDWIGRIASVADAHAVRRVAAHACHASCLAPAISTAAAWATSIRSRSRSIARARSGAGCAIACTAIRCSCSAWRRPICSSCSIACRSG